MWLKLLLCLQKVLSNQFQSVLFDSTLLLIIYLFLSTNVSNVILDLQSWKYS